ncbi:hypothetical protein MJ_0341 [Methanocaldococcus jannaschii DSM 2661]|uniref:Uncharacterized protein MJ0341 n=1 Tax=Methanocaldococcus jannaschii (strain ATCC 43067 / DSM 2661 / JAL-1 / JCM 10045 / NBRC 100440) TaxID=243232 RepID=Y341_METJA|nr:hypothetical protein [Methanocaldococcus jannaschii]Q57787.1 RecName: Full=Uncharacterized protein MJ0341 [Methanocaldococcus jannaschii DSM 2661]AAB98329.1 hypothetical protein MJ_0341 [Methanocaldococcus jannaschii DSM 2661]
MDKNEFLKKLDEKFKESEQKNLEALEKIRSNLPQLEIEIFGEKLTAIIPPLSVEKEMIEDAKNLEPLDFALKYIPILYGIPKEKVEELPSIVIAELIKKYFEAYKQLNKDKSFRNRVGTK